MWGSELIHSASFELRVNLHNRSIDISSWINKNIVHMLGVWSMVVCYGWWYIIQTYHQACNCFCSLISVDCWFWYMLLVDILDSWTPIVSVWCQIIGHSLIKYKSWLVWNKLRTVHKCFIELWDCWLYTIYLTIMNHIPQATCTKTNNQLKLMSRNNCMLDDKFEWCITNHSTPPLIRHQAYI